MNRLDQTVQVSRLLAAEIFERFGAHSSEAQQLALHMLRTGEARLTLRLVLVAEHQEVQLLLEPANEIGEPIEIAASHPLAPTPEGFEARAWFFTKLSHWNRPH